MTISNIYDQSNTLQEPDTRFKQTETSIYWDKLGLSINWGRGGKKYTPNQFVGIGLQAANHTRRTKAAHAAFRGTKYRAIFDQFNKYRT